MPKPPKPPRGQQREGAKRVVERAMLGPFGGFPILPAQIRLASREQQPRPTKLGGKEGKRK
jgi:hypothetical protein